MRSTVVNTATMHSTSEILIAWGLAFSLCLYAFALSLHTTLLFTCATELYHVFAVDTWCHYGKDWWCIWGSDKPLANKTMTPWKKTVCFTWDIYTVYAVMITHGPVRLRSSEEHEGWYPTHDGDAKVKEEHRGWVLLLIKIVLLINSL